jgi:hypothetical protein
VGPRNEEIAMFKFAPTRLVDGIGYAVLMAAAAACQFALFGPAIAGALA